MGYLCLSMRYYNSDFHMSYHEKYVYDNLEFKSWVSEREKTLLRFNILFTADAKSAKRTLYFALRCDSAVRIYLTYASI